MSALVRASLGAGLLTAAALLPFVLPVGAETDGGFIRLLPEQAPFKSPLGAGPSQAVLYGDPSKPGVYVVRNRFPPGSHSNPHFHSRDRHATVIKGVWWTGVGEKLDFKSAVPLKEGGSYMLHPANGVHWDGAGEGEVIVQIVGIGPVTTTQVGSGDTQGSWPKPKPD